MLAMISRRNFFKVAAGAGAAAAVSSSIPSQLFGWTPGLQRPELQRSGELIHLESNENAYGPFPSVLAMGNPFLDANRYPFLADEVLAQKLAKSHRVSDSQILLGCGSTEIIKLAVSAFTGRDKKLVMAAPSFEAAQIHAEATATPVIHVPLKSDYSHDLDAMLVAAQGAGLVYICNPNNPTGSITPRKELEKFIQKLPPKTMVLMDEAYQDFVPASSDYRSFIETPTGNERVIVARTFSKIYGMAGLRLGYAVASPAVVDLMQRHSQLDSINILAIRCGQVSLDDSEGHRIAVARNAADRDEFMHQVASRKLQAIPSSANFVMVDAKRPIKQVIAHFKQNKVRVGRPFPPYDTQVRVSLSTPDDMRTFWRVWDQMA